MSEIDATLNRLNSPGVMHWVVNSKGDIIRRPRKVGGNDEGGLKDEESGNQIVSTVITLTDKAQTLVRDLDPTNDLVFMRIKVKGEEILVAPDKDFKLIAKQTLNFADKKDGHPH
jgi:dynein light chain roadblock-type